MDLLDREPCKSSGPARIAHQSPNQGHRPCHRLDLPEQLFLHMVSLVQILLHGHLAGDVRVVREQVLGCLALD